MQPAKAIRSSRGAVDAASWTWLVAQTAGFSAMSVLSVRVLGAGAVPEGARLVVHEVRAEGYSGQLPLASMQRVLTRDALAHGLALQLFRPDSTPEGGTRIEAWIDTRGDQELEFDGIHATAADAAWVGRAEVRKDRATLLLQPVLTARRAA